MTNLARAHVPLCAKHPQSLDPAAMYLSWVAYPGERDGARRERFVLTVLAAFIRWHGGHAPNWAQGINKEDVLTSRGDWKGAPKRGLDRINKRRLPAVWIALQQWRGLGLIAGCTEHAWNGNGLRKTIQMLASPDGTIDPADGAVMPDAEPDNIRKNVWRESLPALAMTMALPLSLGRAAKYQRITDFLRDSDWVDEAVRDARGLVAPITKTFHTPRILIPDRK